MRQHVPSCSKTQPSVNRRAGRGLRGLSHTILGRRGAFWTPSGSKTRAQSVMSVVPHARGKVDVVIVNESFVGAILGDRNPVGRRVRSLNPVEPYRFVLPAS